MTAGGDDGLYGPDHHGKGCSCLCYYALFYEPNAFAVSACLES